MPQTNGATNKDASRRPIRIGEGTTIAIIRLQNGEMTHPTLIMARRY